jgi:FKBP-type peptidyl-prolyl cis-trans isomerase
VRGLRYAATCIGIISLLIIGACRASGGVHVRQPTTTPSSLPLPTVPVLTTLAAPPTVTNDGLQIIDEKLGDGDTAIAGDIVYVTYIEWLADGTFADITATDGKFVPQRQLLRPGQILPGLIEGIAGMKVGGKRRLVIPPTLAYGSQGIGNGIPADATLVYDIELLSVTHP